MRADKERIWAWVSADVFARIEKVRGDFERAMKHRPSLGAVVLTLVLEALEARELRKD